MPEEKKNDNDFLLEYQEEFLKTGSLSAYHKLWELSFIVTKRIVIAMIRKYKIRGYDVDDISINAIEYVLRRYYTYKKKGKEPYKILNFIVALRFGVQHALFYCTKENKFFNSTLDISDYADKLEEPEEEKEEFNYLNISEEII